MAQVFLSYCRPDKELVEPLIHALRAYDISVWWDRAIEVNEPYRFVIHRELASCGAVLVCWSPAASRSPWVAEEAIYANSNSKYVGCLISTGGRPAPELASLECANLLGWNGDAGHDDLLKLLRALGPLIGRDDIAGLFEAKALSEAEAAAVAAKAAAMAKAQAEAEKAQEELKRRSAEIAREKERRRQEAEALIKANKFWGPMEAFDKSLPPFWRPLIFLIVIPLLWGILGNTVAFFWGLFYSSLFWLCGIRVGGNRFRRYFVASLFYAVFLMIIGSKLAAATRSEPASYDQLFTFFLFMSPVLFILSIGRYK